MTTQDLHRTYWRYVHRVLPRYGIRGPADVKDVAQEVWITVHKRLHTYDESRYPSHRAWITGIVRRCAANYRRARGVPDESLDEQIPATDPDVEESAILREEAAILRRLIRALPNADQREALLLQLDGFSVAEIAAIQDVKPEAVEKRLRMARQRLLGEDDRKAGAYLGFGSLEALAEALRPKEPIPDEVGEQEWERISEAIRQLEDAPADGDPPSSSIPPAAAIPAEPPVPVLHQAAPGLIMLGKGKLAVTLVAAFLGGAAGGAGAVLAWQARRTPHVAPVVETHLPVFHAAVISGAASPATAARGVAPPGSAGRTAAPPAIASSPAALSGGAAEMRSERLLAQMDRALEQKQLAYVLRLAQEHERAFGILDKPERDAKRAQALKGLGREADAPQKRAAATLP